MANTILDVITEGLNKSQNEVCFSKKKHGEWVNFTKKDYLEISNNIAYALLKKGVQKGDNVIIASENNPEWNYVDMALLKLGAVSVPVYATISDAQLEIILQETEAKIAFVSNKYLNRKIKSIADKLGILIKTYSFDNIEAEENIYELAEFGKENQNPSKLKEIKNSIDENEIYSILYTSGTTRHPKGVMLSHKSHLIVIKDFVKRTNVQDGFRTILYLPLNNSFGRTINYVSQIVGMTTYYVNGISKLQKTITNVKPHFMATAPLLLERIMMAALQTGESLEGDIKEKFNIAKQVIDKYEFGESFYQTAEYKQSYELFYSKWKNFLGGEMLTLLAGGALVSKNVHNFFRTLGMNVLSGYGLTETSGVISVDRFDKITKPGYCGQHITGMKIKISDEGEILAKGDNLMQGYYKHPEITEKTIDSDGWIHTGDLGELDEEGYLSIKGRIKSTFKLISGDFVYPKTLEEKLKKYNYIGQVIVVGLGKEYVSALIVPNFEAIKEWAKLENIEFETPEEIINNEKVIDLFNDILKQYNNISLNVGQRVEKFKLLADQWSIETGEITPTMKIRRNFILDKYQDKIEELYK